MPKKLNDLERTEEEIPKPLGISEDMIASVQPAKKKRVMSEEQKAKQLENLRKGREARAANLEAKVKETAKMLHDTVVQQEVTNTKPKKEDHKLKKILEAVGSIASPQEELEEEIVVVKKRKAPKKTIIIQEDEEEEAYQPPPPPQVVSAPRASGGQKPKRQYNRKKPEVQASEPEPTKVEAPKQSIIFY